MGIFPDFDPYFPYIGVVFLSVYLIGCSLSSRRVDSIDAMDDMDQKLISLLKRVDRIDAFLFYGCVDHKSNRCRFSFCQKCEILGHLAFQSSDLGST